MDNVLAFMSSPPVYGFAFSEPSHKPGFAGYQYAELMLSLGYNEYVYQGGDFGHTLGVYAVNKYGNKHIKAWHTNMPVDRIPTFFSHPFLYLEMLTMPINKYVRDTVSAAPKTQKTEMGYYTVQATKPQTLAYGHTDPPIGFLAWVHEKLVKGSDNHPWTDDEVLEWISVYWFSRAGPAACTRIYYELSHGNTTDLYVGTTWASVPLGVSYFPKEPIRRPEQWPRTIGKVVFQARHDEGGHFAAFEQPEALVGDLRNMFGKGGSAHDVIHGHDGY